MRGYSPVPVDEDGRRPPRSRPRLLRLVCAITAIMLLGVMLTPHVRVRAGRPQRLPADGKSMANRICTRATTPMGKRVELLFEGRPRCTAACTCKTGKDVDVAACLDRLSACRSDRSLWDRFSMCMEDVPLCIRTLGFWHRPVLIHRTQSGNGMSHVLQTLLEGVVLGAHWGMRLIFCPIWAARPPLKDKYEVNRFFDWPRRLPPEEVVALSNSSSLPFRSITADGEAFTLALGLCSRVLVLDTQNSSRLVEDLTAVRAAWTASASGRPHVVYVPQYMGSVAHPVYEPGGGDADLGHTFMRAGGQWLQAQYQSSRPRKGDPSKPVAIASHIRRGDIVGSTFRKGGKGDRFRSSSFTLGITLWVLQRCKLAHGRVTLDLYTEPNVEPETLAQWNRTFATWPKLTFRTHVGAETALPDLSGMAAADVLVTSRSGFSALAGLLSCGLKVGPHWYGQLPLRHLVYDHGNFSAEHATLDVESEPPAGVSAEFVRDDADRSAQLLDGMWEEYVRLCRSASSVADCCDARRSRYPAWPPWNTGGGGGAL